MYMMIIKRMYNVHGIIYIQVVDITKNANDPPTNTYYRDIIIIP